MATGRKFSREELRGLRDWRMGPWRHRRERWDLLPVSDLNLEREAWSQFFLAGLYTAGQLAAALAKKRRPAVLRDKTLRAEAERALAEIRAQCEPDRLAIEAEVAELLERTEKEAS